MKKNNINFNFSKISKLINKASLKWAINFLKGTIKENIFFNQGILNNNYQNIECIIYDANSKEIEKYKYNIHFPKISESFVIQRVENNSNVFILYGSDERGLIYVLTEIADRIKNLNNNKNILSKVFLNTIESPKTKIRSISKCFESNVEDLSWFKNKKMWKEYLNMLIINRFNRFTFTLGMQYNYPYGNEFITDVYLYLPYPFLIKLKKYKIYAEGLSNKEIAKNFEILKFISDESSKRGLEFQLAIWTQRYDFNEVPNANYQIRNIPNNYAEYCRDSLEYILKKCPNITGLTLRVHVECGIPEGQYKFWKTYFQAITNINRDIQLDLHAKGIDQKLINLALNVSSRVSVSPKYTAEHMGLPYHQASIRKQEMPPKKRVDKKWIFSEGKRKFMRYSYGDLLKHNRKYGIMFRIWPGTQRVLIWGDPELARGYGQHSTFCNSLGVELCEPLSFKGRMGTGIKNGRFNYLNNKLRTNYDWQKYEYTYRIWGRCTYNYDTSADGYSRYLTKLFGDASEDLITSLSYASKILPFFTLVHGVSASNNSYWPEIYENMSTVEKAPHLPYSYDLHKPSRFGMATSQDPQLIMSPTELANCINKKKIINKYSPITMANWFAEYANKSKKNLLSAIRKCKNINDPEFKRLEIDIRILSAMGLFFSYKIKSSCYWELFLKKKEIQLGRMSLKLYKNAYNAWEVAANISKKYYVKDLTYGPQSWLRGRWDDRLPAIKTDIIKMENIIYNYNLTNKFKRNSSNSYKDLKYSNNNQCFNAKHVIKYKKNDDIEITLNYKNRINKELFLHYRRVNQSEKWKKKKVKLKNGIFLSLIEKKYHKSDYPIQYYFQMVKSKRSYFYPGLKKNLSNQPYFIFKNI